MEAHPDITRTFLGLLFVGALIGMSLWILKPFLGAVIWAVTIVTATWPLMISIQNRLWGRRSLAVAVMTVVLLCVLVVPLWLAIGTIVSNADRMAGWMKSLSNFELPPAPALLASVPILGSKFVAASSWRVWLASTKGEPSERTSLKGTKLLPKIRSRTHEK